MSSATIPNLTLHESIDRAQVDAGSIITEWLETLEQRLSQGKVEGLQDLFLDDSWWRDIIALSWAFRLAHGPSKITQYLRETGNGNGLSKLKHVEDGELAPRLIDMGPFTLIESAFSFETNSGPGRGVLRLGSVGPNTWKAWILMTWLEELKGHDEFPVMGPYRDETNDGEEIEEYRVVVVGAGHAGLSTAARLKQLGVPTLVIDKQVRLGDSWRLRYSNLKLHDPKIEDHLPYLDFPESWPLWLTRNDVADWLEHYQAVLDIPVRLETTLKSATWDDTTRLWSLEVTSKDGMKTILRPGHVVLATGVHSDVPTIPKIENQHAFTGQIWHTKHHTSASTIPGIKGKKVAVIGSSSSAHDVCYDFATHGADVTMIQRGVTAIYSLDSKLKVMSANYMRPGISTKDADLLANTTPQPIAMTLSIGGMQMMCKNDSALLEGLAKTEFKFLTGENGFGLLHLLQRNAGNHYIDQGCTQLIIDGKIKVRQCDRGLQKFEHDGLVLADGRKVAADIVVMATGYQLVNRAVRDIMGPAVADRCRNLFGTTEEGERSGLFQSPGHPGFWLTAGSFAWIRSHSRTVALQIKAVEEGLNLGHYEQ